METITNKHSVTFVKISDTCSVAPIPGEKNLFGYVAGGETRTIEARSLQEAARKVASLLEGSEWQSLQFYKGDVVRNRKSGKVATVVSFASFGSTLRVRTSRGKYHQWQGYCVALEESYDAYRDLAVTKHGSEGSTVKRYEIQIEEVAEPVDSSETSQQPCTEREQREIDCFGQTLEQVKAEPMFEPGDTINESMYAMQILSDAQHVLAEGDAETCRQWINKAKYWISEINAREMEKLSKGERA